MTSVAIKPLHLRRHLMGSYESFYSIFWREAQSLWVDLLVTVGHPVEIVQVRLLLGRAEARGGGHGTARSADRGGRHRACWLQTIARTNCTIYSSVQWFFLDIKLHQVKVIDVLHGKGAGWQFCCNGQLSCHTVLAASLQFCTLSVPRLHTQGVLQCRELVRKDCGGIWDNELLLLSFVLLPCSASFFRLGLEQSPATSLLSVSGMAAL